MRQRTVYRYVSSGRVADVENLLEPYRLLPACQCLIKPRYCKASKDRLASASFNPFGLSGW